MTSLCEHEARCGSFSSFAECMSIVTQAWLCPMYRTGVKDGRIAFDAAAAMEYERQLRTTCAVPNWDLFAGLVPLGGACFGTQECVSTARCDITLPTCPGLCVAKKQIGAVALSVDDCADGLAGFVTVLDGGNSLVCQPVATLGQRCTGPRTCARGLFCNAAGACAALLGPNQPCGASDGGQTDERWCRDYLECQAVDAGPLECLPPGGLGAPCGICQLGLRCVDGTSGRFCGPRGIDGQSCNASYECVEGLFCQPTSGIWGAGLCRMTAGVGDPCTSNYECGRGVCEWTPQGSRCVASDGGWHQGFTVCEDPTP